MKAAVVSVAAALPIQSDVSMIPVYCLSCFCRASFVGLDCIQLHHDNGIAFLFCVFLLSGLELRFVMATQLDVTCYQCLFHTGLAGYRIEDYPPLVSTTHPAAYTNNNSDSV